VSLGAHLAVFAALIWLAPPEHPVVEQRAALPVRLVPGEAGPEPAAPQPEPPPLQPAPVARAPAPRPPVPKRPAAAQTAAPAATLAPALTAPASSEPAPSQIAAASPARVFHEHEVDRVAAPIGGIRPVYPPRARQLGREGVVVLLLTVDAGGRATEAEVTASAGADFDEAARAAALAARFRPASSGGREVASRVTLRVRFRLE
jgi:protein TonB